MLWPKLFSYPTWYCNIVKSSTFSCQFVSRIWFQIGYPTIEFDLRKNSSNTPQETHLLSFLIFFTHVSPTSTCASFNFSLEPWKPARVWLIFLPLTHHRWPLHQLTPPSSTILSTTLRHWASVPRLSRSIHLGGKMGGGYFRVFI